MNTTHPDDEAVKTLQEVSPWIRRALKKLQKGACPLRSKHALGILEVKRYLELALEKGSELGKQIHEARENQKETGAWEGCQ